MANLGITCVTSFPLYTEHHKTVPSAAISSRVSMVPLQSYGTFYEVTLIVFMFVTCGL